MIKAPTLFLLLILNSMGASEQPNVLFISIDDLATTLGCYGDEYAQTPNIDSVAAQGTTFLNHHTQWPVCGPSRAALTTGLMPEETGVIGFRPIRALLPTLTTLPQHFKNEGYTTACAGKFHDNRTVGVIINPDSPTTNGNNIDDLISWSLPYVKGAIGYEPANAPSGSKYATNYHVLPTAPLNNSDYTDGKILTAGLNFLDQVSSGASPFFIAVGFKKPHLAFIAPKASWDLYDPLNAPIALYEQLPLGASSYVNSILTDNGELFNYAPYDTEYPNKDSLTPTLSQKRELIHGYYSCVSFIDNLVGELTQKLSVTADPVQPGKMMNETTIIIIWGDHGFSLGQHGKWGKHTNTEQGSRCPLIIYDPRSPTTGAQTTSPAQTIDIYPTLCELTGIRTPTQPVSETILEGRPLAGRSLTPLLENPENKATNGAITVTTQNGRYGYAYRTEEFRYIEWINSAGVIHAFELYDYTRSPLESRTAYRVDLTDSSQDIINSSYEPIIYGLSTALRKEVSGMNSARSWDPITNTRSSSLNRLQRSSPLFTNNTLTQRQLPFTCLTPLNSSTFSYRWPDIGATYKVLHNTNLSSAWNTLQNHITQPSIPIPATQTKEFFHVEVSENTRPTFLQDPIVLAPGISNTLYTADISTLVTDSDVGDTISFSLEAPSWLTISATGVVSGTPSSSTTCETYFTVIATDNYGASSKAKLHIPLPQMMLTGGAAINTFNASDDAYVKEAAQLANFGHINTIQLRQDGSSNSSRIGFIKVSVAGVNSISSATLHLYSDDEDNLVNIHSTTNLWNEQTLNWVNKPVTGGLIGSALATPNNWFSIDVTSYVTTNGTFSFIIDEQGNSAGKLKTKEGGKAPYLQISSK